MTDDIVTRLRDGIHDMNARNCASCDAFCCECELCDCCVEALNSRNEAAYEIERLRIAYKDLFQIANHAYCYNNFGVLQAHMKEHQATAKELGLYP